MKIKVMKNGVSVGFVKSISEKEDSFELIQNKNKAKEYEDEDTIQKEIDVLARISSEHGLSYVFLYL